MMIRAAILLVLVLLSATTGSNKAYAATMSSEQANAYYYNCAKKEDTRMRRETREALCACEAAKLVEVMTPEELAIIDEQSAAGGAAKVKLLAEVMTPCVSYALPEVAGVQCLMNERIDKTGLSKPKEEICACVAAQITGWFGSLSPADISGLVLLSPESEDAIGPILKSHAFRDASYKSLTICMRKE